LGSRNEPRPAAIDTTQAAIPNHQRRRMAIPTKRSIVSERGGGGLVGIVHL
jgi:hypothetical protein